MTGSDSVRCGHAGSDEKDGEDEDSFLACWAHGIVHVMEGDLPNARYWYGRAKRAFPAEPAAKTEIEALAAALAGEK